MTGIVTNEEMRVATTAIECNASLYIKECLWDIMGDLTFAEKRAIVRVRQNNWCISQGETYRHYIWRETYYDEEQGAEVVYETGGYESECCEIPEMAAICTRLNLWG